MEAGTPRFRRGLKLTQRLALALTVGAVFIALVLGFLHASSSERESAERQAQAEAELTTALSERAAPLLERGDLMRLSVLATVARDQVQGRVLVLDRGGRVVLDTALVLGDRQLGLLAGSGPFQRTTVRESTADEPRVVQRETLAPIRFGGDVIGEFRMQREVVARKATFDFAWFGLVLLSCLSLVVVAVVMGHHWSMRIRRATDSLIRLSAGEAGDVETGSADSEMRDRPDVCCAMATPPSLRRLHGQRAHPPRFFFFQRIYYNWSFNFNNNSIIRISLSFISTKITKIISKIKLVCKIYIN